jgi:HAD superfamily hydrolase (TIGR01509 family)
VIEAILWDNDGVLVDTEPLYLRATREALTRVDVALTQEQYVRISLREGRSLFDLAREAGADAEEVEALRTWRNDRYDELLREGTPVLPGVAECLAALHGRHRMGVVTSSLRDHFDVIHRSSNLLGYFEFALTASDVRRHKPHPEPYLRGAERLGLPPSACLAVEDTERGLEAAVAAGMHCVVVPHGLTRDGDFSRARAVLESVADLPAALERLR